MEVVSSWHSFLYFFMIISFINILLLHDLVSSIVGFPKFGSFREWFRDLVLLLDMESLGKLTHSLSELCIPKKKKKPCSFVEEENSQILIYFSMGHKQRDH